MKALEMHARRIEDALEPLRKAARHVTDLSQSTLAGRMLRWIARLFSKDPGVRMLENARGDEIIREKVRKHLDDLIRQWSKETFDSWREIADTRVAGGDEDLQVAHGALQVIKQLESELESSHE